MSRCWAVACAAIVLAAVLVAGCGDNVGARRDAGAGNDAARSPDAAGHLDAAVPVDAGPADGPGAHADGPPGRSDAGVLGYPAFGIVSGGVAAGSAHYRFVGSMTGGRGANAASTGFKVKGGVVGATQSR